jgi:hypothetical protein
LPNCCATASAAQLADTWTCLAKRGKPATWSLQFYGWFTEGFDKRDLKEAKALLGELVV